MFQTNNICPKLKKFILSYKFIVSAKNVRSCPKYMSSLVWKNIYVSATARKSRCTKAYIAPFLVQRRNPRPWKETWNHASLSPWKRRNRNRKHLWCYADSASTNWKLLPRRWSSKQRQAGRFGKCSRAHGWYLQHHIVWLSIVLLSWNGWSAKICGGYSRVINEGNWRKLMSSCEGSPKYQCPVSHSGEWGQPRFEIYKSQLDFLRSEHFRWASIARLLGVSERTLRRRRSELGLEDEEFT